MKHFYSIKIVPFSRTWTGIVGFEGKHNGHHHNPNCWRNLYIIFNCKNGKRQIYFKIEFRFFENNFFAPKFVFNQNCVKLLFKEIYCKNWQLFNVAIVAINIESKRMVLWAGGPCLVVMVGDSLYDGCGFESQKDTFSHLFVVKFVMFFDKTKINKRGREWPIF